MTTFGEEGRGNLGIFDSGYTAGVARVARVRLNSDCSILNYG